jgi:LacI family transcriptional regulator
MMVKESTSVGIKEIARALGISIGTVDRALHARPGVSPKTSSKVLKMAEKLNYKPNIAARNLKLNRRLRIAVHLPEQIKSFFDPLRAGIRAAATAVPGAIIELEFHSYPRAGQGDIELLEAHSEEKYDGLILLASNAARINPVLKRIAENGTAIICVASDAPRVHKLTSICADASVSGSIAADLLSRSLQKEGNVVAMMGDLNLIDHAEKLRGFAAGLATYAPHLRLQPVIESHEMPEDAYQTTLDLLDTQPLPAGIYIGTANSMPVLQALEERGVLHEIRVVTTDLFPELVAMVESNKVLATLFQRPYTQGTLAIETLVRFLLDGVQPQSHTRLAPYIVLRSNLSLYLNQIADSIESEDLDSPGTGKGKTAIYAAQR